MPAKRPALFPSAFFPHIGGVEELTRKLALEQRRRGLDPLVVTNQWPRQLPASEIVDDLQVRRLPFRVPGWRPRQLVGWATRAPQTQRDTVDVLRDWRADVVHVQCVSSNAPFASRASRQLQVPLVVTAQGELTMDADQIFQRLGQARTMLRTTLARADVVTGCSEYVIRELDRFSGGRFANKMRVIYNGVDVDECAAAQPEHRSRPYLIALGRLVSQKGHDVLIKAFATLASVFPDLDLLIVGGGPEATALGGLVDALGLGSRVTLTGPVGHDRALSLVAGAEIFTLCSREEPQGIVVLEAMAAGTPVVASDVGGVAEVVDGNNGLLVPAGDHLALAEALGSLLRDPVSRDALREAARSTVSRYSWSAVVDGYDRAYADAGA